MLNGMATHPTPASAPDARQHELEEEEDRLDAEDFRVALEEFKASGEKAIPLDEVLAGHGLTRADLSD